MGPTWPNISPRCQDGSTWARLGPTWAQPALNIGPDCFHTGKHCALCLPQFNIALPGFARRISAQSSHTISQTSLLGRRPAVRRKPLNMTRSGSQSLTAPEEKYMLCALCSHLLHSLTLNIKQLQLPLNFTRLPKENNTRVVAPNRKIGCNVTSLT